MVHLAPGDPIAAVMPAESSQAEIEATKRAYGFDKPLPVQYLVWLGRVAQGDLGKSIATRRAVILDVRDALANSLVLALSSSLLAFALGLALGLLAAFRQGRALDKLASAIAVIGVSVPHYWAGIILIIIFSVQLNWLPAMGAADDPGVLPYLRHITLPTVALALTAAVRPPLPAHRGGLRHPPPSLAAADWAPRPGRGRRPRRPPLPPPHPAARGGARAPPARRDPARRAKRESTRRNPDLRT